MLKIVYPICCGIDVNKKFIVACIASTDNTGITTYKSSRFSTFTNGLRKLSELALLQFLHRSLHGIYWQVLDTRV